MRMLVDASFASGKPVGIARYLNRLAEHLAPAVDLTMLTSTPELFAGIPCRVVTIPAWTRSRQGALAWEMTYTDHRLNREHDVILCATPAVPLSFRLPAIAVVHDLIPLMARRQHSSGAKALFWLSLQTLRRARAVVCDSDSTRRDLAALRLVPESRMEVVYPGPGLDPLPAGQMSMAPRRPFLLYVGGHSPHKNVPRLIEAFARLDAQPDLQLVLVGWGSRRNLATTARAIEANDCQGRVTVMESVDDRQLSSLYRLCRAFVFPSMNEGFGLPVLEALAHGAPVACSRSSSLPEVAGEAAVYFDPHNVPEITQALRSVFDAATASRLRELGVKRAARFSWDETARRILQVARRVA